MLKLLKHMSLAVALVAAPSTLLQAQNASQPTLAPPSAAGQTAAAPTWTLEQILPLTVHQAWLLSGKNEATFFEMVTQMAEVSAKNRNLQLPENAAAGRRVGEHIKTAAKADTGQLLFALVDSAVRKVGTPLPNSGQ